MSTLKWYILFSFFLSVSSISCQFISYPEVITLLYFTLTILQGQKSKEKALIAIDVLLCCCDPQGCYWTQLLIFSSKQSVTFLTSARQRWQTHDLPNIECNSYKNCKINVTKELFLGEKTLCNIWLKLSESTEKNV